ncbi:hypothetical protein [Methanobrevibacter woesei]|uniref:hypothetical protein n=1 Tax=Methanobrevibacter woesei TaxID=190976 RepID=UPI0024B7FB5E|nr:hypothetical protein [Methanobrevibacter woesei]
MKCKWCGKEFIKTHNRQMYCCSECSRYAHMEQKVIYARKYRKLYAHKDCLGSGGLGSHPDDDFKREYMSIQREKHRLKI